MNDRQDSLSSIPPDIQAVNFALAAGDFANAVGLASVLAESGGLGVIELIGICERLTAAARPMDAVALYRRWLECSSSPFAHAIHFNLGVLLGSLSDRSGAESAYREALRLQPSFCKARFNLGGQLERQGRVVEALEQWRVILEQSDAQISKDREIHILALNNLGRLLEHLKQYEEAEGMLEASLRFDPNQPDALQHWVHLRQKQCKWPIYAPFGQVSKERMFEATSPLAMLSASNDPKEQLAAARRYVEKKVLPAVAEPLADSCGYRHEKLKIGYLSSDFCLHPVSMLTAELFELHDRAKFEVHGFCWSPEDGSTLRKRVVNAMDRYLAIGGMSDLEAAQAIRAREIDILVDLQGLTAGARPNILSYRPAPIQIAYLGFPGTTALPCADYVIADRFVLPEESRSDFSEQPLYMPHCFQINDRRRAITPSPTRKQCGLPEHAFAYCSFNNNFKFTEDVFATWMRILKRVPNSVLWLLADNEWARDRLKDEAKRHGIESDRLIFALRAPPAEYLARYRAADLFLDTFPFNAGATASDALWMGLPLLTCAGRTFASRMAGSLLSAIGLPELIAENLLEYEEKAVDYGLNPGKIEALKKRLEAGRANCRAFDSPAFVRALEETWVKIVLARRETQARGIGSLAGASVENAVTAAHRHRTKSVAFSRAETGEQDDTGPFPLLISLGFSCQTRFTLDVFDCSHERLPYDFNISTRDFVIHSLLRDGAPFWEGDCSIFAMPEAKIQGVERNGVLFWHDFDRDGPIVDKEWRSKLDIIDSKYRYLWDKFTAYARSERHKVFYISNSQCNLSDYAFSDEDYNFRFRLDTDFYLRLKNALRDFGARNFEVALLNRDIDDARALRSLSQRDGENLVSKYVGILNLPTETMIANLLIPGAHQVPIDRICGKYTNGCFIERLDETTADVFVEGLLWGQASSYFNGYLFVFKSKGVISKAAFRDGKLIFDNRSQWLKAKN